MAKKQQAQRTLHYRFARRQCTPTEIGLMIAAWNIFILIVLLMLAFMNPLLLFMWLFLLIPLFFTGYWLWISQHVIMVYHRLSPRVLLRITLTATLPFAYCSLLAAVLLYVPLGQGVLSSDGVRIASAFLFTGLGLTMLCPSVLFYGLQHRIHLRPFELPTSRRTRHV